MGTVGGRVADRSCPECCGEEPTCCFPGWYGCNPLLPHLGDTIAANRAQFTGTGSIRYRTWMADAGGGGGPPTERIDTAEVALALSWQGYDPGGGVGCLVESAELGAQSLHGKQTLNGATLFDRTETFRRKVPASLHWGHAYPVVAYRIAEWYLWPDVFGAREGTVSWLLLGEVPHAGTSYANWANVWQQLRQRPDLGWPNTLLRECNGNYSRTLAGTVYSMVYSGAVTAGGGNFSGAYRQTSANTVIEMDIAMSWSVALTCGTGGVGGVGTGARAGGGGCAGCGEDRSLVEGSVEDLERVIATRTDRGE